MCILLKYNFNLQFERKQFNNVKRTQMLDIHAFHIL